MSISHGDALPTSVLATQTLAGMLERAAKGNRGIIICHSDNRRDILSYQDLLDAASCMLTGLRQQGLQPQDNVILQLQNPRLFFTSLWACFLGGVIPIPLGVDLTFYGDISKSKLYQTREICQDNWADNRALIVTDIKINSNLPVQEIAFKKLLNHSPDYNYYDSNLDSLTLLLFTSGSTAKPKGVMLSGRNLVASVYGMAKVNNLSQQDITLNWMPLEHVASLVMFHLTEVYLGCQQIQVSSEVILQDTLQWLNLLHKYRVNATWSPNFAYNLVNERLDREIKHNWDLSCVRWMGNGAEAVVGKTAGRFIELLAPYGLKPTVVSPGYGMSETTSGICHSHDFYHNRNRDFVSVGSPIPGVSLRIVDEENKDIPEGTTGLLQVKGETVTAGYYQQPLNEEIFTYGWFYTGDLGFIEQGKLTITGRQEDVIIINGVNYYNHDIETIVEEIAGVTISFTAACGVLGDNKQEQVAIFFNTEEESDSLRELINTIRRNVFTETGVSPTYIIPVAKETIPKTAIGKIMRSQLSQRFNTGEFKDVVADINNLFDQRNLSQQDLPGNAIEQKLVAVWREVLNLQKVGVKDNFFELGGNSLLLMQVLSKLTPEYNISAVTLFQYPTISALADYLSNDQESVALEQGKRRGELRRKTGNKDVAIIGMSCRFPGANNIEEFWDNLCSGVESISFFEDEEIINSGVDKELINNPNYVKASPILEDIEGFDADFWGFSPKEAKLLDPQQRLFLECAWESLEDAGYDPLAYKGDINLYGGAATNTYLLNNIYPNRHHIDEQDNLQVLNLSSMGGFQVSTANDKDYLTTRTSYKLNLTGSSINVQTACSTSLVTIHLACQSLINAECDMALASGVSVHSPQKMGYLYQEGMILSPDGHCRAFDADAAGTVFGSGAGMVVLKLLDKAIAEGDRIYGIVRGSAVNNDGGTKVGYLAPNVDGQTRVIAEALAVANIPPDTVNYIEAHGTGTKLGDPIEVKALSQAYHQDSEKTGYCAMGSVKSNVGHLQMASGIVGFIKAVLCLYNQKIPASLHLAIPNPQLNLDRSPFYINAQLKHWTSSSYPRRGGVNSLGIGGTNAHVILEEFVDKKETSDELLPAYLLPLSAKNETALQELAARYREYITTCHETPLLRDICLTSNVGRHHFDYRCAVVAKDKQDLINQLANISINNIQQNNKIAFLFTGQGSQYVGMGQQLYNTCDVFKENCDRCWEILRSHIDVDRTFIDLDKTQYAQPLLFITEYSLAQMWIAWGIKPDVVMGHSIGEYVAATIAGVFSLEDALKLVCVRGKLMGSLPENGAMLAVFGEETKILDYLSRRRNSSIPLRLSATRGLEKDAKKGAKKNISVAANNGTHIVLSGFKEDINSLKIELDFLDIKTQLLNVSHGFHSPLMQPIVKDFKAVADTVSYSTPIIPIVSNLTGELADETIATADYWIEHILQPVQFAKSIKYLERQQVDIFLEVGTKPILRSMAQSILDNKLCLHTLDDKQEDWKSILLSLSDFYKQGLDVNWLAVDKNYRGNKTSLPTYPFQRQRYWFDISTEVSYYKNKNNLIHPLLGSHINSPLKQTIFQSNIEPDTINWLQDHRIEDKAVFPGTAYLEMAIALSLFKFKKLPFSIKDINIPTPLYIDGQPKIQSILSPLQEYLNWEIYSLDNDQWQLHATGEILSISKIEKKEELEFIKSKFSNKIDIKQHYISCQQKGINYGKSFQIIKELYAKEKQALGLIELPRNLNSDLYNFHPALLDSCLQIIFAALPKELQATIYVPVSLDKFDLYNLPQNKVWSYLELKPSSNNEKLIADVWLYQNNGELIAKIEGLKSQAINPSPAWHNWLYQTEWQPQPLLTPPSLLTTGTWLIFADSTNKSITISQELSILLKSQQQQHYIITRNEIADDPQAFIDLIKQHPHLAGVIYLWSLDSSHNWEECKSYLYLVQALIKHESNPPLWYITQNAQPVNNHQTISGIKNSTLWGMQKAIALEHPELRCAGIDIDSFDNFADTIFQEICARENEQIAYRNHQRYVLRLVEKSYKTPVNKISAQTANLQLQINHPGNLDSLKWKPVTRQQPTDN
ncbi:MAG: beta-ketoacyl synthase N-terminal-like domain-containing protein, partial [Pleurocapsa sp.]